MITNIYTFLDCLFSGQVLDKLIIGLQRIRYHWIMEDTLSLVNGSKLTDYDAMVTLPFHSFELLIFQKKQEQLNFLTCNFVSSKNPISTLFYHPYLLFKRNVPLNMLIKYSLFLTRGVGIPKQMRITRGRMDSFNSKQEYYAIAQLKPVIFNQTKKKSSFTIQSISSCF